MNTLNKSSRLRIIVLGYIVRCPLGGMALHYLQYVMGLIELGHDVYFVEDSDDYPGCYNPSKHITDINPDYGLKFTANIFCKTALNDRWAYFDAHTASWLGPCADRILDICSTAELVLNISGSNPIRPWIETIPNRVLIDTDPAFTQIRNITIPKRRELALKHTSFFSFGENIESGQSLIPDDGFKWKATRQPVVLSFWPISNGPIKGRYTTIMQWDSYPAREFKGVRYGMKSDSFMPYMDIPLKSSSIFELAVGSSSAPKDQLSANRWHLCDPLEVTRDPWTYQNYIQQSKAELGIAKHGYVTAKTGWFSERSAGYLASGRPVLAQNTGFSNHIPTGAGLLEFSSSNELIEKVEEINSRYEFHCHEARCLVIEYFDSSKVLTDLIERAMEI